MQHIVEQIPRLISAPFEFPEGPDVYWTSASALQRSMAGRVNWFGYLPDAL
ncbi:MAG: hypothetical protein ABSF52_21925 [Syntrophobacteraceae bacterium]|jgi:hypothetical protein